MLCNVFLESFKTMLFIYCGPMQYLPSLVFYSIPPSELESLQLFVTPEKKQDNYSTHKPRFF